MKLYIQYVRPNLEFASQAWLPWQEGDKFILEKFQEKALKMVDGIKANNYKERCEILGWIPLRREESRK